MPRVSACLRSRGSDRCLCAVRHREAKARRLRSLGRTRRGLGGTRIAFQGRSRLPQAACRLHLAAEQLATHTSSAVRHDAELIVSATNHLIGSFAAALIRSESQLPDRCPKCLSYQVESGYVPELEQDPPYLLVCRVCGWEAPRPAESLLTESSTDGAG
jgi:hypothetical protein